ncbi:PREDICTED: sulfhydryl oxidase 2 [Nicrophorus vespilloides]|uniref:Sulfhydryl oxidase n=1 Tax=Nicrophorus vespilloides TaxID=110193 RepID=A0ABM1MFT2_NICVS|nr:PREDICTED: sulfhydryl oxidase 2 [Nicrophorus vespilloides]
MNRKVFACFLIVAIYIELSDNASLSIYEQKKYKSLIEGQGLYSADDDVEILTNNNFKKIIYGQKNAWIVEFYNSWCGFCQRFAPSWKSLAKDIKDWKNIIKVGAIDCSDDDNSALCRNFEIMAYPTLKYFHENYIEDSKHLGADVTKGTDMGEHKNYLIKHMILEQENKRGLDFPTLLPYKHSNILHLFDSNVNAKYVFLVIDKPESMLGPQLSLDFNAYKEICVRYATTENEALTKKFKIQSYPFMTVLTDSNTSHDFNGQLKSREDFRTAIIEYVNPSLVIKKNDDSGLFTGKWVNAEVPDIGSLIEAISKKQLRDKVKKMGNVVFQADLESALRYSLKHEIGTTKDIFGEKLDALKAYFSVLIKYFPFGIQGKAFLEELLDLLKDKVSLDGATIVEVVNKYDTEAANVFSSKHQWIACDGSTSEKRGYPCGLWMLFHFLTVEASEKTNMPKEVLHAMKGYIKNYFGCADCSRHFQEMAVSRDLEGVTSANSAILWLWMAHNTVNKRLSGDVSEDPEFPKVQFPSATNCPKCRLGTNWDYNEVLKYLKIMYNSLNIRYIGADSRVMHPGVIQKNMTTSVLQQMDASYF